MHCLIRLPGSKLLKLPSVLMMSTKSTFLKKYNAPSWAEKLKCLPKYKVELANLGTPIHSWSLPNAPSSFSIAVKRDDMTGSTLSGNKVRKLEFLLAEALDRGCKHVITCGGIQSNHCRATAMACRQLGLIPHLFLRSDLKTKNDVGCEGNLLLDRLSGAEIYMVPWGAQYDTELKPRMEKLAEEIRKRTGEESYLVPIGGSNKIGMFGYITAFQELISQGVLDDYDDVVFACGSGGTAEGLAVGNYLTGSKLRIHGIVVSDDAEYYRNHVNNIIREQGLEDVKAEDIVDLIEGHKGPGYGVATEEGLNYLREVSTSTGVILDPVYTGKATQGMVHEMCHNPQVFKGKRVLFLHTGGLFGLYDGRINTLLKSSDTSKTNNVKMWLKLEESPTL